MVIPSLLMSPTFWIIWVIIFLGLFMMGKKNPFRKIPILNMTGFWIFIGILGLLATIGILSVFFGDAGLGTSISPISDLQVTTAFNNGSLGGSVTADSLVSNLENARFTAAQISGSAGTLEIQNGILTVTRTGSLTPTSCVVKVTSPDYTYNERTQTYSSTPYNIVRKDSYGKILVYVQNAGAATTSSPIQTTALSFADGVATATLGIGVDIDSVSFNATNQYTIKPIVVDVCGKAFTFNVQRLD